MLKYCLSTGKTTTDKITYVKDLISVNLLLRKKSIPYWNGGSENLIEEIRSDKILDAVNNVISEVIEYITNVELGINVSMSSISLDHNIIHVELNINGSLESYDITE